MRRFVCLTLVLCATGCKKSGGNEAGDPAALVQVKTAVATVAPFAETISAIGNVNARSGHIASLSAPAPARIATVYVSMGAKVSVGTALVAFEQAPFRAAAISAEAALTAAQKNYVRARRLADAGIVPRHRRIRGLGRKISINPETNQPVATPPSYCGVS